MVYIRKKFRRPEVYGITGFKGHGKDTFAKLVLEARGGGAFVVKHFAGPLKQIAQRAFGLTHDQMHNPVSKEALLSVPVDMDLYLRAMKSETGLDIKPANMLAKSPREIMQFLGTDYVRKTQDDYWIQRWLSSTLGDHCVLVPDLRFPNEEQAIRSVGGLVIRIVRIDAPASTSSHSSETEIDKINADLVVGVRTGDLSIAKRVATLIARNKFKDALRFDYRGAKASIEAYNSGRNIEESSKLLYGNNRLSIHTFKNLLLYYGIPQRKKAYDRVEHRIVSGIPHKLCCTCKGWKPHSEFNVAIKSWDLMSGACRPCCSRNNKESYQKYQKINSIEGVFKNSRRAAKDRKREFDFSLEEIQAMWDNQQGICAYTGMPMNFTPGDPWKTSLDRIDSSLGYIKGNVVLCGLRVNFMKRDLTLTEFYDTIQKIHNQPGKP